LRNNSESTITVENDGTVFFVIFALLLISNLTKLVCLNFAKYRDGHAMARVSDWIASDSESTAAAVFAKCADND
jgi:hypothetical protein